MTQVIPMLLWCPSCRARHIDEGEFATKPHHTHACQHCGMVWRPAVIATVGVAFLPGFKDEARDTSVMPDARLRTHHTKICMELCALRKLMRDLGRDDLVQEAKTAVAWADPESPQ